jgi:pyruvate dehydrogenase E1 component alpha subunit
MAKLWGLPVLYIIENNEYAMGTSVERASSVKELYKRGESFGIVGKQVDGMDFFSVYDAVKEAADYIRKNSTPCLLEIKTYRYRGHSMSDPANYRTKDEVDYYKKDHDPLISMKEYLTKNENLDEDCFKAIDKRVKEVVKESVEFAKNSPEPEEKELYTDVHQ